MEKLAEFEDYARSWIQLVEEHGGRHRGYFVPTESNFSPLYLLIFCWHV